MGRQPVQAALQLAHVLLDSLGHQFNDALVQVYLQFLGLGRQNGHAGFQVRGLNVGNQAPLEPGAQAVFQQGQRPGRPVRGQDNLVPGTVQVVEGVEEAFLGLLLAAHELHVVDQQHLNAAVTAAKVLGGAVADGRYEIVGELLR